MYLNAAHDTAENDTIQVYKRNETTVQKILVVIKPRFWTCTGVNDQCCGYT